MAAAIILAGGLGIRLRNAVPNLPKPMAPLCGKPFLAVQMDYWLGQGIDRFILSVGYRRDAIMDYFGTQYRGVPISYAIEESPLGTGGGLLLAAQQLLTEDPFLLLNGDTYFSVDLPTLTQKFNDECADWCLAVFRTPPTDRYMGMSTSASNRITSFVSLEKNPLANGGVYWLRPHAIRELPRHSGSPTSLENDLLPTALAAGQRMFAVEFLTTFIDIGIPCDYARAQLLLTPGSILESATNNSAAKGHS